MEEFSLLIKPVSADCNLKCDYCFYLEKSSLYPGEKKHRMSEKVLEQLVKSYLGTEQSIYSFGWQGGEPTLMGVDFYKKVVGLQQKYGRTGALIGNGFQTNTTLVNTDFAKLFSEYKFLLGCSLDGPEHVNNKYRRFSDGRGSHHQVMEGIKILDEYRVEYNILTLVSQANVGHAKEVYRYLCDSGFRHHQYIPCVEFDENGSPAPYSISAEEWGDFLCELYDLWYPRDIHTISIRHFDSILTKQVEGIANVCTMGDSCSKYFVVEYNGDVYPCDFFVAPEMKLGNILVDDWKTLQNSNLYRTFSEKKIEWNSQCNTCDYLFLCRGDCLKHRMYAGNIPQNLSYLCGGWKKFLRHSESGFQILKEKIQTERLHQPPDNHMPKPNYGQDKKIGRNDLCFCGSGKKYKKCCGFKY
ncbi:anaerobic sulfatase maturase [bacterium]|nr:anaerobic sulfatase maturase [bacterium]